MPTDSRGAVLVIGAGMAGLTAATELHRHGIPTVVVDKGRAPGGRMATRTIDGARFDHGAQHFAARSPDFAAAVERWRAEGIVASWFTAAGHEERLAGTGGMRRIPEHLASTLDVRTAVTVDRLAVTPAGVTAWSGDEIVIEATGVVLTPPLPQLRRLLDASGIGLSPDVADLLDGVTYDACLAVMATLDRPAGLPDGHRSFADGPVAWIGDNHHKGTSAVPAVTIHSSPEFSARHLEGDPAEWTRLLCEAAVPSLAARITDATGHRWRYAQPRTTLDIGALVLDTPAPIVLAGEAFAGAKVEGAFRSGITAADRLAELL